MALKSRSATRFRRTLVLGVCDPQQRAQNPSQKLSTGSGQLQALDHQGKLLWSAQAPQKPISEESHDGELSVQALEVTDLLKDGRQQTVVLYYDPLNGSPPLLSILDSEGKLLSLLLFPSGTSPVPQDRSPYLDGFLADPRQ